MKVDGMIVRAGMVRYHTLVPIPYYGTIPITYSMVCDGTTIPISCNKNVQIRPNTTYRTIQYNTVHVQQYNALTKHLLHQQLHQHQQ
jgi:hypothetical protein